MLNVEQRVCSYKKKIHNWGYKLNPFPTLLLSASLLPGTNNCVMNIEIEDIKKKKLWYVEILSSVSCMYTTGRDVKE